jgi:hypothetical protein
MIHDKTRIHDLVQRIDDAEATLFELTQNNQANLTHQSPSVTQATILAMVDTRMVSYNARDKDELRNILDTQHHVLEDIETHLRHIDAENDDRVEHLVDERMQCNAMPLWISINCNWSLLHINPPYNKPLPTPSRPSRKRRRQSPHSSLPNVRNYRELKDKLREDLTSDFHSHKQQCHADFEDLSKKLNQQAATLQNQLHQIRPPSPVQPAQAQPALVQTTCSP